MPVSHPVLLIGFTFVHKTLASNHHYHLRYANPGAIANQEPREIWVLLTRHVVSKTTQADFIALHHFSHGEAGKLLRADQVPNKVIVFTSLYMRITSHWLFTVHVFGQPARSGENFLVSSRIQTDCAFLAGTD